MGTSHAKPHLHSSRIKSKLEVSVPHSKHKQGSENQWILKLRDMYGAETMIESTPLALPPQSEDEATFIKKDLSRLSLPFTRHVWLLQAPSEKTANPEKTIETLETENLEKTVSSSESPVSSSESPEAKAAASSSESIVIVYILHMETADILLRTFPNMEIGVAPIVTRVVTTRQPTPENSLASQKSKSKPSSHAQPSKSLSSKALLAPDTPRPPGTPQHTPKLGLVVSPPSETCFASSFTPKSTPKALSSTLSSTTSTPKASNTHLTPTSAKRPRKFSYSTTPLPSLVPVLVQTQTE